MATSPISLASMFMTNLEATKSKAQTAAATSSTAGSTTSGSGLDSTTTGTTFLSLLVKELQNQDPTAPMDSTDMVGQMISLNSLDQLISINQTLSTATGTSSTSASTSGATSDAVSATSSAAEVAARTALLGDTQSASAIQNATQSALDPTKALDLSTINMANGGKI